MIAKGLEGIVAAETNISLVDGTEGHLVYRGHWAKELAVHRSFEEAAYLLWHGTLPSPAELREFTLELARQRRLTPELSSLLGAMPPQAPMMSVLQSAVSALSGSEPAWPPTREQALRITALLPVIIAYRHHRSAGTPWNFTEQEEGHVSHYLRLLFGRPASEAHVRAMTAYMILAMEHGLNASTFAARVVSSTESDMYSAVGAAIGAMKGPLHGGAPSGVLHLLDEIGTADRAEPVLRALLERGERLMGFGHRVYKTRDPRAEALREVCTGVAGGDPWLDLAGAAEQTAIRLLAEYKPGRRLYTNVEFYAAAVMRAVNMPSELFTPTFTAARIVGWTAHVLEQAQHNRIYRPQSRYTGVLPD
ncbi:MULTISPECIES: citrate synthase/methylcitrate synthase [Paenibacillus]|uniref:citrate synthase/methylcitrate synthase n=1 Tax=Paenibacillus TaxID=44249 RepID=UPI0022B8CB28|nr:citrate synthase/methylcitrate synthase [Paenibacillus caseinilyticus]MCZ8521816.1 citrate synthase/methylcitrate synthase [Paenibacillus caseinilyticus]